jgi:alpha-L-arabinofuranosidase
MSFGPRFLTVGMLLLMELGTARGQISGGIPENSRPIEIRVHADGASIPIPETLFGSFLEPIGNSTYNGLWAELLQNPSFEPEMWSAPKVVQMVHDQPELARASELDLPIPWAPLYANQGNRYEPRRGDTANSNQSLQLLALPAEAAHHGEAGIRQRVYLPVRRVLQYSGSLWIKAVSGPPALDVSLRERDHPEHVLAHATLNAPSREWTKYPFTLELGPYELEPLDAADFVISVSNDTRAMIDQASLIPADAVDNMDPDVLKMAKELRSPLVRFGGNFTSSYHWRDGIGPPDKRISMLNLAWGIPEYNTFGTDEFLRFCRLIGAQPQIALNLGSGTPEEAADWVRYVNEHWADHRGGLLWEMGNELWGNWNMGYPTLQQLGERTERFSTAIRKGDPTARLIAPAADEDFYRNWNAQLLATPAGGFNYISTHFVVTTSEVQLHNPSNEFVALANFALPVGLDGRMKEMTAQIQQSSHKDAKIAFTEWLFIGNEASPSFRNMAGAIDTAGFLNMLFRNADIVPISDMTGIIDFAGISKERGQVYGAPGYWVLRMYSNAQPTRRLKVEDASPVYSVAQGSTRLPEIHNVPWLEVEAAQGATPDKLVLFCVNRSLNRDLAARIDLEGFVPRGTALIQTLTAPSIYAENDAMRPNAVTPRTSSIKSISPLEYTFPHASVVVIELTRDKH